MNKAIPIRPPARAHIDECERLAGEALFAEAMVSQGFLPEYVKAEAERQAEKDARDRLVAGLATAADRCGLCIRGRG